MTKPVLTKSQQQTVRASEDLWQVMMQSKNAEIGAKHHVVRRNARDNFRWATANWWDCCEQVLRDLREAVGSDDTFGAQWDNRRRKA